TMLPPGFPAILAFLAAAFGDSHVAMVRSTAVFTTLGLGASYLLMRREAGRAFAATVTAVLFASPVIFRLSTRGVISDLPYLLTSVTALLLVSSLDAAETSRSRAGRSVLCGFFLVASLLIRSAGITLLAGIAAWLVLSFRGDRESA